MARAGGRQEERRVGILGGSFDPVHEGHLAAAEEASAALSLERCLIVPVGVAPHKASCLQANAADRLAMARLAVAGRKPLEVSDVEASRPGPSYTVDTVRKLSELLGDDVELYLILGTDAVRDLPTWREPAVVFRYATPVVIERPGEPAVDWETLRSSLASDLVGRLRESSLALRRPVDVSATEIRRRIAAGEPTEGLIPPAVSEYIAERGLYRGSCEARRADRAAGA